jgi:hypothetical protein
MVTDLALNLPDSGPDVPHHSLEFHCPIPVAPAKCPALCFLGKNSFSFEGYGSLLIGGSPLNNSNIGLLILKKTPCDKYIYIIPHALN